MDASSDMARAVGLGIIQGVTEFLPVSSSGHLAAFTLWLDAPPLSLELAVLLHASTLLATLLVFREDLRQLLRTTATQLTGQFAEGQHEQAALLRDLAVACVPTAILGVWLEPKVEALSRVPAIVGSGFLISALVVLSTRGRGIGREALSVGPALLVGVAQGIAVLPGISRSGATIACAMALGMSAPAAFRFSFLVSIPAIVGAALFELGAPGAMAALGSDAWLAAAVTFVCGYFTLRWLRGALARGHFWLFAWYLLPLGAAVLIGV